MSTPWLTPASRARVSVYGWRRLPSGIWVTATPLIDTGNHPHFAHLDYTTLLAVCERIKGARPIAPERVVELNRHGFRVPAVLLRADAKMSTKERCDEHDREIWLRLAKMQWDGALPVSGAGKPWVDGALPGRSRLLGWAKRVDSYKLGPQDFSDWHQPLQNAHNRAHADYSSLCTLEADSDLGHEYDDVEDEEPPPVKRATIRRGSLGADVKAWQTIIGVKADGSFGPATHEATKAWQEAHGLVGDGIVGAKSWAAAGETHAAPVAVVGDPRAPACVAALRDATAAWPGRSRISDGIMGDARHQASKSDHNLGNAVDITHDPKAGCDGNVIASEALKDPRTKYVIWNAQIWNNDLRDTAWRPYGGSNPHRHHVHVSIRESRRGDAGPWGWAPESA